MMKLLAIIEKTDNGYSAYLPDLPGCIAAADTREETEQLIREGAGYYIEELQITGQPMPEPSTTALVVEVELPTGIGASA